MSTRDYAALSYEEKRELLRINGNFVSEKIDSSAGRSAVFALYGFYVEMNYDLSNHVRYIRVMGNCYEAETSCEKISINLN